MPDSEREPIFNGFKKWRRSLGYIDSEIKGSKLNEGEIASLIDFLTGFDLIFELAAIDMIMQSHRRLRNHRLNQAAKMTENVSDEHHPNLVKQLEDVQNKLEELANPLYVQAFCTFHVLYNVFQKATLYYVQKKPKELGNFHWIIDAKDRALTPYEELWTTIVLGILQSVSFEKPFITVIEGDYSSLEKYFKTKEEPPEYLKKAFGNKRPFDYLEINEIFKRNLSFEQSHKNIGLQLVDILTTSARRAMNGNLQIQGWRNIGRLMVTSARSPHTIGLVDLCNRERPKYRRRKPPYWEVLHIVDRTCKPLFV